MHIQNNSHLSYCTNIHPGESWPQTFENLKTHLLFIKKQICPDQPFGIGLRLSNEASLELIRPEKLRVFKKWLSDNDCYLFTMNGFPYGGFHDQVIKDKVHAPDWTTAERLAYTKRLAEILAALLPEGMTGGISTSPLSYRWWHSKPNHDKVKREATEHLMQLVLHLHAIKKQTGRSIHIDIEPEPDGLLETGREFLEYYTTWLLGDQLNSLTDRLAISGKEAEAIVKEHLQLCFDICHFAVEYEDSEAVINQYRECGIPIGKIQISAALKATLGEISDREKVKEDLRHFVEPGYLHQAVLQQDNGTLIRHKDLDTALGVINDPALKELRTHYHVPVFTQMHGQLQSTQDEIVRLLNIWKEKPFCRHLEVETYTWQVLPDALKKDIGASVTREMKWVLNELHA